MIVIVSVVSLSLSLMANSPSAPAAAPSSGAEATRVVAELLARMERAEKNVRDYTATFHRQELVDGTWRDKETILLKWRRPRDLFMRWPDGERALLWRTGWEKMKIKEGVFTLDLALDSWFVTRESRHTIADAGLSALVRLVLADAMRARKYGGVTTELLPRRRVHGAPSTCWVAVQPKAMHPEFYSARTELCVDDATGLPNYAKSWDLERVIEEYSYADVKLNVGLTDADFSTDRL